MYSAHQDLQHTSEHSSNDQNIHEIMHSFEGTNLSAWSRYGGLPLLEVEVGGHKTQALVDTGATKCLMSSELLRKLSMPPHMLSAWEGNDVTLATDIKCSPLGLLKVRLKMVGRLWEGTVLVMEDLTTELIIGVDLIRETGLLIDLQHMKVWYSSSAKEVPIPPTKKTQELPVLVAAGDSPILEVEGTTSLQNSSTTGSSSKEKHSQLQDVLQQFSEVLGDHMGRSDTVQHHITTNGSPPCRQRPYPYSPEKRMSIQQQVEEMLKLGVVEPSKSPWASPVVIVKKKDGSDRFCVDYRRLNQATQTDAFPMVNMREVLDSLHGAVYFSTLDLRCGYWQIAMSQDSREATAFITHMGLYQFKVMPFGLKNAPATFQRLMNEVLRGLVHRNCFAYLDDIVIFSSSWERHLQDLTEVLQRLKDHGLTCKLEKCVFGQKELKYLGHIISDKGVAPDSKMLEAMNQYPRPSKPEHIRQYLGMCNWYGGFIERLSDIAEPLTRLLKKNTPWKWSTEAEAAFQHLKEELQSAVHLSYPNFHKPFVLQTDASSVGLGAILYQMEGERKCIITYASKTLNATERCYHATERECLAVVWAVKKFRPFLDGHRFTLVTDNSALKWLASMKDTSSKLARWSLQLQEFDFEVQHCAGTSNQAADALSRNTVLEDS